MLKGLLITIEGIDGSGKTTLIQSIAKKLLAQNIPFITTKEPGGTDLGKQIRSMVQNQSIPLCPKAEFLLFSADRAQHFEQKIIPALTQGVIVLSDRMGDSSVVYQGYARGLDIEMINSVNTWTMNGITPDITFYLRIEAQESINRILKRNIALTAFEKESSDFTQKLIAGFDDLFKNKAHVILLNGTDTLASLTEQAYKHIQTCIKNKQQQP